MISRSTLIGALVVVELAIVGMAARALGAGVPAGPMVGGTGWGGHAVSQTDQSLPTGPAPVVTIDVHDADVAIQAAPSMSVRVSEAVHRWGWGGGTTSPSVKLSRTADGVRISAADADDGNVHFMMGGFNHDVTVFVPATAQVTVVSAGKVAATGMRAPFVAHVDDGDITLADQRSDVDVSTNDGDVELTDVEGGTVAATTNDGHLVLSRVSAETLRAHSDDGRVTATDLRAVDGTVTTNDGHVTIGFAAGSDTVVNLHTDDGGISINGTTARDDEVGNSSHTVRIGSGRGHFDVSSGSGDITINQGATV
jgi:hypothetical protein